MLFTFFLRDKEDHDTVGAVAVDKHGTIAVATSTGGTTGQKVGRIGDSPIIGNKECLYRTN